jgi:hypothetical protein
MYWYMHVYSLAVYTTFFRHTGCIPPGTHKKKKKTSDTTLARKPKKKRRKKKKGYRPGESRKVICEART